MEPIWRLAYWNPELRRQTLLLLRPSPPELRLDGKTEGSVVTAGDVIGYMGHTGYSAKENVNNIDTVHLHFGLQLIFDESQKEGNNEIWVECYNLTRFFYKNRCEVQKVKGSKEWKRTVEMKDDLVGDWLKERKNSQ